MQCIVVKSLSVKGVQTTDEDVHYLAKGGSDIYSPLFTHISIETLFHSIINSPSRNAYNIA